jgi:hypothetical protein
MFALEISGHGERGRHSELLWGIAVSCLQQSKIFALRHNREPANAVIVAMIVPGL